VNANSDPSGHPTDLLIDGAVTLDGHGQFAFDGASQSIITGTSAAATLTNVDNTISGSGQLGNGQLTLVNDASGVIDWAYPRHRQQHDRQSGPDRRQCRHADGSQHDEQCRPDPGLLGGAPTRPGQFRLRIWRGEGVLNNLGAY
jgi:hypothetical protein